MKSWTVKRGNTSIQDVAIKDSDGALITTLDEADEIIFQVRKSFSSAVLIEKTLGNGIEVDTPSEGYLRITLTPEDTDIEANIYCMALQITWHPASGSPSGTADLVYEVVLKVDDEESNKFVIKEDMI